MSVLSLVREAKEETETVKNEALSSVANISPCKQIYSVPHIDELDGESEGTWVYAVLPSF